MYHGSTVHVQPIRQPNQQHGHEQYTVSGQSSSTRKAHMSSQDTVGFGHSQSNDCGLTQIDMHHTFSLLDNIRLQCREPSARLCTPTYVFTCA